MATRWKAHAAAWFKRLGRRPHAPEISMEQQTALQSVGIFLGPYRNLTTLISAILNLHPHCQVLNHAAPRVLDDAALNFLSHYSDEKFRRFCGFAIEESQGGRRGDYGGSITLSHAFDHEIMSATYQKRYGGLLRKSEVHSIIWKDSQRITNYLREHQLLNAILAANPKVRFLMPIRNPMDCAISNSHSRKSEHLLRRSGSLLDILAAVCREIAWFEAQRQRIPDRFFSFFEHEFDEVVLRDFARFLGLAANAQWIEDALRCYQLKPSYDHGAELIAQYKRWVGQISENNPRFAESMAKFIP